MEFVQWEYKIDFVKGSNIQSRGLNGWEAVNMCVIDAQILVLFKRPIDWKKPNS